VLAQPAKRPEQKTLAKQKATQDLMFMEQIQRNLRVTQAKFYFLVQRLPFIRD
jgi:hypothetical protein